MLISIYKSLIQNLLFRLDPEDAHNYAKTAGKLASALHLQGLIKTMFGFEDPKLCVHAAGIDFPNPIGLAAGFDKNGELINFIPSLGFGFFEIGSVTAKRGTGNKRPRVFRLPVDNAIINRMGLNNEGADEVYFRLYNKKCKTPYGVNIAKTHDPTIIGDLAIRDFQYSFDMLYGIGDYLVINISCPNTREGKTFEDRKSLEDLLTEISSKKRYSIKKKQPILLKLSPDLDYVSVDKILEVAESKGIEGYVVGNTTKSREKLQTSDKCISEIGIGGLSGAPLKDSSTRMISYVYTHLAEQSRTPFIIGCGGVSTAEDAYTKIAAGATLVQVYTGLIYEGPAIAKNINSGLVELINQQGMKSISEAVGTNRPVLSRM